VPAGGMDVDKARAANNNDNACAGPTAHEA